MPPDPSIRNGTPEDDGDVARLVYGHPSPEASGLAGGAERATQLGLALFRAGIGRTPDDEIYLATLGGRPVGVLLGRGGESRSPISLRAGAALFRSALRLYAPWEIPGLLRRLHLRSRLDFPIPPGSFHVVELHVDPRHRGRSIGTALLRHAERRAGELGYHRLDLTTATANQARRLYERLGFEPLGERTVRGYERITGSRGRVFLGKALGGDGSRAPG